MLERTIDKVLFVAILIVAAFLIGYRVCELIHF
jgi:hypothetical protein